MVLTVNSKRQSELLIILDLGSRLSEWLASRRGRALPQGKDHLYPLDSRLDRPQRWAGQRG
jgi:hypothetical protein